MRAPDPACPAKATTYEWKDDRGYVFSRTISRLEKSTGITLQMSFENRSQRPVNLREFQLCQASGSGVKVAGKPADWFSPRSIPTTPPWRIPAFGRFGEGWGEQVSGHGHALHGKRCQGLDPGSRGPRRVRCLFPLSCNQGRDGAGDRERNERCGGGPRRDAVFRGGARSGRAARNRRSDPFPLAGSHARQPDGPRPARRLVFVV